MNISRIDAGLTRPIARSALLDPGGPVHAKSFTAAEVRAALSHTPSP